MDTIQKVLKFMKKGMWVCKIDLKKGILSRYSKRIRPTLTGIQVSEPNLRVYLSSFWLEQGTEGFYEDYERNYEEMEKGRNNSLRLHRRHNGVRFFNGGSIGKHNKSVSRLNQARLNIKSSKMSIIPNTDYRIPRSTLQKHSL